MTVKSKISTNVNIDLLNINKDHTVKDALEKISKNKLGIIFVSNEKNQIIGCITDGDLRSFLLHKSPENFLSTPINECMNKDFVYIYEHNFNHESLLKILDNRIKLVPILNENLELINYATKESLNLKKQKTTIYRSKSPVRISFSGGGTDISSFFTKHNSFILNATINLYSYATLKIRNDSKIKFVSHDLNIEESFNSIAEIHSSKSLSLVKSIVDILNPPFGFELTTRSDVSVGSGLGGSAVILSAIIGAFDMAFGRNLDQYEIAQMAYQSERINQSIAGGWQDQYATVFGGFNYIELNNKENIVHPLRVSPTTILELEESLVLANTGLNHDSNDIHIDQKKQMEKPEKELVAKEMLEITEKMKQKLLKNKLLDFGKLLHQSWELKKKFSSHITMPVIDTIYEEALKNGALGGKLLGAGGGGYLLFFVPSEKRISVVRSLIKNGLTIEKFQFASEGLRVWKGQNEN